MDRVPARNTTRFLHDPALPVTGIQINDTLAISGRRVRPAVLGDKNAAPVHVNGNWAIVATKEGAHKGRPYGHHARWVWLRGGAFELRARMDYVDAIRPLAVRPAPILDSGSAIMSEADPSGLFSRAENIQG